MRDYVFHQAQARESAFLFPTLRRALRNWMLRRQLLKLGTLDDYLLADIGLTRDDLRWGLRLPRDVDAVDAMNMLREERLGRGTRRP